LTSIKILATGSDFLKEGVRGTSPVVEEIMKNINNELHILAYVISKDAENFLKLIENSLESGVQTTLVIDNLKKQDDDVQNRLLEWNNKFEYFKLVDFNRKMSSQMTSKYSGTCSKCGKSWNADENIFYQKDPKVICKEKECFEANGGKIFQRKMLHAKVVVVDREKAVLGSANFSWGGMSAHYEVGVLLEGPEAWTLSKLVDDVANSPEN